jgi:tape measure domain-containing protein
VADLFKLQGVVTVDATRAETGLKRVDESARGAQGRLVAMGGAAAKASSDLHTLSGRLNAVGASLKSGGQAAAGFGRSLSVGLTLPLVGFGAAAVKAAVSMDSLKRGLVAVSGSSAEAERQLVRLKEVAKLPGLGFKEAIQGSVNLQAAGFSAQLAERSLKAFGNALATVGKGKAELDGVVLALTQIQSKGKVSAEEINQIAERVPQIRRAMIAAFGTADTEILQKAKLTSTQFVNAITRELEKLPKVTGGAQNSFENLADTAQQSLQKVGAPILRTLIPALDKLAPKIEAAADWFSKLSPEAQNAALGVGAVGIAAGPTISTLANATIVVSGLARAFTVLSGSALAAKAAIAGGWIATIGAALAQEGDRPNSGYRDAANRRERNARTAAGLPVAGLPVATPEMELFSVGRLRTPEEVKAAREAEAIKKRIAALGTGGAKTAKELSELQQLQKQLGDINKEIAILTKATSAEFKVKMAIEGAQAFQQQIEELLKLQAAAGMQPGVPTIQYGKAKTLDSLGMARQLENLRGIPFNESPAFLQSVSERRGDEAYGAALEIESQRLEEQEKLLINQTRIADTLADAADNLRDKLASLGERNTEENAARRKLRGMNVDFESEQGKEYIGLARQVDAQQKYADAMERSREATDRFTEQLKNTFQGTIERLLRGDTKGALGGLKNFGIGLASQGLTNALFGGGQGGSSPALAGAGGYGGGFGGFGTPGFNPNAGGGGFGGFARQSLSGGNGILNTALGFLNKGSAAKTGWGSLDAFTGATKAGGGLLGKLFGGGGGFLGKLFGGGGAGAAGASGGKGLLAALGFSNPISAIVTGGLMAAPFIAKLFGKDPLKDYRNHIRSEYGVDVQSKSLLNSVMQLGQSKFGANYKMRQLETVRLPETREMVFEYAGAYGLKGNSRLFSAALLQDPFSAMNLQKRAMGGDYNPGWLLVGERGPELMRARTGGTVIPNHELGGGGNELAAAVMLLVAQLGRIQTRPAHEVVEMGLERNPRAATRAVESDLGGNGGNRMRRLLDKA